MVTKKSFIALVFVSGCAGRSATPVAEPEPQILLEQKPEIQQEPEENIVQAEEPEEEPASLVEEEPTITTLNLCEPIGERRGYPDSSQKKQVRALIRKTCRAMGVGSEDCKFFYAIISLRESGYRWWVRHRLSGDVAAAIGAYLATSHSYGWDVRWDHKARKREDLSALEFTEYGARQNPYFQDPKRWMFGLGLGGLNISYHLVKFDRMAPPEILCDPVINAMVQIVIARNAVHKYKAQNFAEIQAIYAGRKYYDDRGRVRPLSCARGCPKDTDAKQRARARKGDAMILKRCKARGLDCLKKPQLGSKLNLKRMPREDRYKAAEEIRGEPLPPFDTVPETSVNAGVSEG